MMCGYRLRRVEMSAAFKAYRKECSNRILVDACKLACGTPDLHKALD